MTDPQPNEAKAATLAQDYGTGAYTEGPEILIFLPNGQTLAATLVARQYLSFVVKDIGLVSLQENALGFRFQQLQFMPEKAEFVFGAIMCITEMLEPLKTAYKQFCNQIHRQAASSSS